MTEQEALKWLDEHKIGNLSAKAVITKALEKQIPKKPARLNGLELCPCCGQANIHIADCTVDIYFDCCSGCGQAIDWSNSND